MKIVAQNRRARFDLEISDTLEAGIILTGQEVKSCRAGNVHLAGSYVSFLGGKPLLRSAKIAVYAHASGLEEYDPGRDRQLLLSKVDLRRLQSALDEKGMTLVPLEVRAGKYIKVLLGLGKGRARYDKRQKIKEKDIGRRLRKGEDY
ncbi:SsrA-binding protein [Candidatus Peregrinibacteria bacterium CG10_big_fil_rev_8_21_14_0_10_49_10]|nr:MAG: SsrA-binding protein [Candidatus Peregrinibacteria bacterium CG10_big_fil_rev_8_21_14_0_10_49_10]